MKIIKVSIIALLFGLSFGQLYGQSNKISYNNLPYRPWKTFNRDTLAYLTYNYGNIHSGDDMRKRSFKGLKVSDLFSELELPVAYATGGESKFDGKRIGAISILLGIRQTGILLSPIIDYYIEVRFSEPLSPEIAGQLDFTSHKWTSQAYEILKDVELSEVFFNAYYPPKGREDIIERTRKWQKQEVERKRAGNKQ